jgi:Predicted flavin-nucleotide-binding protein
MNQNSYNTQVRRKNREITSEQWIIELLRYSPFGTIAMANGDQPYINANLFLFDEKDHSIYFHTAGEGFTKQLILQNQKVCFSVFQMGRLLPGKKAVDFSSEYKSVVIFGLAEIITDLEYASNILKLYFNKYGPQFNFGKEILPFSQQEVERTTVFRIRILDWTGKQNKQPENYPGAYNYFSSKTF